MKTRFVIAGLTIILAIGLVIQGCGTKEDSPGREVGDSTAAQGDSESTGRDSVTYTLLGRDSVTVYQLLQESHYVEARETSMGVFIMGIDSVRGGSTGNWVYTINDTVPKIAADKMFTRAGDTVVWKFRVPTD